jgi:hypothetical protein
MYWESERQAEFPRGLSFLRASGRKSRRMSTTFGDCRFDPNGLMIHPCRTTDTALRYQRPFLIRGKKKGPGEFLPRPYPLAFRAASITAGTSTARASFLSNRLRRVERLTAPTGRRWASKTGAEMERLSWSKAFVVSA